MEAGEGQQRLFLAESSIQDTVLEVGGESLIQPGLLFLVGGEHAHEILVGELVYEQGFGGAYTLRNTIKGTYCNQRGVFHHP